ncbi:MAG: hypothetical protein KJ666_11365, partial [Bacteroidetes bacterium]|nr:hypothetical protein [Bacteroidota bacterium]MBU2584526.1 hypothetical protein [Bacteroidota bacterium]
YLQVLEFPTRFTAYAVHPKDPLEKMGSEVSREPIRNENSVDCVTSVTNDYFNSINKVLTELFANSNK